MENKKEVPVGGMREIIFYRTDSGDVKVEILLQDESLWLTQAKMAELFDVDRSVITKHIGNIVSEHELTRESTCAIIAQVQTERFRKAGFRSIFGLRSSVDSGREGVINRSA